MYDDDDLNLHVCSLCSQCLKPHVHTLRIPDIIGSCDRAVICHHDVSWCPQEQEKGSLRGISPVLLVSMFKALCVGGGEVILFIKYLQIAAYTENVSLEPSLWSCHLLSKVILNNTQRFILTVLRLRLITLVFATALVSLSLLLADGFPGTIYLWLTKSFIATLFILCAYWNLFFSYRRWTSRDHWGT